MGSVETGTIETRRNREPYLGMKDNRPRKAVTEDEDSKRGRDPSCYTLSHQETPLGNHHPQKPWRSTELRGQANVAWICFHPQLRTLLPSPENLSP